MDDIYSVYHSNMQMDLVNFKQISLANIEQPSPKDAQIQELSLKKIYLKEGEELLIEPGAILACENITCKTERAADNVWESFKRYLLGQEHLFFNRVTGGKGGGWVTLEEAMDQEIAEVSIDVNSKVEINRGTFLASTPNVALDIPNEITTLMNALWSIPLNLIPVMLKVHSTDGKKGRLYIGSNSSQIKQINITAEEGPVYIDNNNFIAIDGNLKYQFEKINNSFMQTILSGEGYMFKFTGSGKVYLGTRVKQNNDTVLINTMRKLTEKILPFTFFAPMLALYWMLEHPLLTVEETYSIFGDHAELYDKCKEICRSRLCVGYNDVDLSSKEGSDFCHCKVNKLVAFLWPKQD